MFKTILATAAVTFAVVPALAQADEARQFSHEGTTYAYSAEQKGKTTVISGNSSQGAPFRLYVTDGQVRGTYNGQRVSFTTAEAAKLNLIK
ncbi:hypothetical protein [Novosphingobium sp. Leaf2]|uniref:hypothetical protein n=1 Tax=Novosphingobium sp. Leaf2 TaxID=1735670 RepID=UPI0006FDB47C|nr:hypothetical protein [Novosphingobium sp. Leaf2]KQM21406.1 hypothetical protein ASE49_14675 [Novosphingobium sp. Leaf2]